MRKVCESEITVDDRDGSSLRSAIIVCGIAQEYDWIEARFPKSRVVQQTLSWFFLGWFDVIDIVTEAGEEHRIYFRISPHQSKAPRRPD